MDWILDFLKIIPEYKNWGMNDVTISFIGTVIFTVANFWSIILQNKTITEKRSGESVSITLFNYISCYCAAFFVYGCTESSLAMMFNGLLAIPYFHTVYLLYRFKGFGKTDWILLFIFSLMIPTIYILEKFNKNIQNTFLLIVMMGILLPLLTQFWEMYKTKSAGSINPKLIIVLLFSTSFWFIYGVRIGNLALTIINPIALLIFSIILILYYRYKKVTASV